MKAVIFAGGFGTRMSEESGIRPKPMVEIGGKPILWHVMKIYSAYGINDFIVCCGYKSQVIKDYFANYALYNSDVTFDVKSHSVHIHKNESESWKVTLAETGINSTKSQRLLAIKDYLDNEAFCLTYGDGVSDINIPKLIAFHQKEKALVTITAVQPPGRYGGFVLKTGQTKIVNFKEKPIGDGAWINGGFMVVEPEALAYIRDPKLDWEDDAMRNLAERGKLSAFVHTGYWQSMDTLRDKNLLEETWQSGKVPWKVWK
jgi:glucose-1-phosphate cytidylyltransferase